MLHTQLHLQATLIKGQAVVVWKPSRCSFESSKGSPANIRNR